MCGGGDMMATESECVFILDDSVKSLLIFHLLDHKIEADKSKTLTLTFIFYPSP